MSLLAKPGSDIWIRGEQSLDDALGRTTHLAIGAHQDDLEFMAFEGIAACYDREDRWFTGVTVTDGRGSSRVGPYAGFSDEQMREKRREEQREAAAIGRYAAQFQLDYSSAEAKGDGRPSVTEDLVALLERMRPQAVYLHQPADKHDSHVAVLSCCIEALRRVASQWIPDRVIGCEVWRGLDWLADSDKVAMDCGAYPELAQRLAGVFDSQIAGGKRYDLATLGRQRANATFFDSHGSDQYELVAWGMDLKPLIEDANLTMEAFVASKALALLDDVKERTRRFS